MLVTVGETTMVPLNATAVPLIFAVVPRTLDQLKVELPGAETVALSGDPACAADDLVALGERLSRQT